MAAFTVALNGETCTMQLHYDIGCGELSFSMHPGGNVAVANAFTLAFCNKHRVPLPESEKDKPLLSEGDFKALTDPLGLQAEKNLAADLRNVPTLTGFVVSRYQPPTQTVAIALPSSVVEAAGRVAKPRHWTEILTGLSKPGQRLTVQNEIDLVYPYKNSMVSAETTFLQLAGGTKPRKHAMLALTPENATIYRCYLVGGNEELFSEFTAALAKKYKVDVSSVQTKNYISHVVIEPGSIQMDQKFITDISCTASHEWKLDNLVEGFFVRKETPAGRLTRMLEEYITRPAVPFGVGYELHAAFSRQYAKAQSIA